MVRNAFNQPISNIKIKSSATDLVTETDQEVEKLLIHSLSTRFPNHKYKIILKKTF